jgi:hypothetical protein
VRARALAVGCLTLALGCGGRGPAPEEARHAPSESGGEESRGVESHREESAAAREAAGDVPWTPGSGARDVEPSLDAAAALDPTAPARAGAQEAPTDAAIRANLDILERQSRELEQVAAAIEAIRPLLVADASGLPPICTHRAPLEGLRMVRTSGGAGASAALGALEALETFCAPFDRWAHPTDREARQVRDYFAQLDRIAGWMRDIERCAGTGGAERARCLDAYGEAGREVAEEASRALVLLDAHRRELGPVRSGAQRFACETPVLARLAATRWTGTVARAQLGTLARQAEEVCRTFGVDAEGQRRALREVTTRLDRAESAARSGRRVLLESIASLRAWAP